MQKHFVHKSLQKATSLQRGMLPGHRGFVASRVMDRSVNNVRRPADDEQSTLTHLTQSFVAPRPKLEKFMRTPVINRRSPLQSVFVFFFFGRVSVARLLRISLKGKSFHGPKRRKSFSEKVSPTFVSGGICVRYLRRQHGLRCVHCERSVVGCVEP